MIKVDTKDSKKRSVVISLLFLVFVNNFSS